jgi:hypothetical protein
MDVSRVGGMRGKEEGIPGIHGETTKEEKTGFFCGVGKESGANTVVFAEGVPVVLE